MVTNWVTGVEDLCADCAPMDQGEVVDTYGPVASLILWALTGRQFDGVHTDKVWPNIAAGCSAIQWWDWPDGLGSRAVWPGYPNGWSWRDQACGADHYGLLLPHRPVRRITEVMIGGEVVDPATYRIMDRRWAVRCNGQLWPCFQQVCSDGFTITYEWGVPPPAGGARMAGALACELAKACIEGCSCRLPARTQNVVQEGITTALIVGDPIALLDNGLTNITEVDLWVKALNPHRIDRPAKVLTPFHQALAPHHLRAGGQ